MFRDLWIFFQQKFRKAPLQTAVLYRTPGAGEYARRLQAAAAMPGADIKHNDDDLTDEETVTLYSGKCPNCDAPLYKGPEGGGAINLGCPLSQGGCGAKYWEGAPFRPMKLTGIVE